MKAQLDIAWKAYLYVIADNDNYKFHVTVSDRPVSKWVEIHHDSQRLGVFLKEVQRVCGDDVLVSSSNGVFTVAGVMVFLP